MNPGGMSSAPGWASYRTLRLRNAMCVMYVMYARYVMRHDVHAWMHIFGRSRFLGTSNRRATTTQQQQEQAQQHQ